MATARKTTRTLALTCPYCHATESLSIDPDALPEFVCQECDERFTPTQAADLLRKAYNRWVEVGRWLDTAPTADTEE